MSSAESESCPKEQPARPPVLLKKPTKPPKPRSISVKRSVSCAEKKTVYLKESREQNVTLTVSHTDEELDSPLNKELPPPPIPSTKPRRTSLKLKKTDELISSPLVKVNHEHSNVSLNVDHQTETIASEDQPIAPARRTKQNADVPRVTTSQGESDKCENGFEDLKQQNLAPLSEPQCETSLNISAKRSKPPQPPKPQNLSQIPIVSSNSDVSQVTTKQGKNYKCDNGFEDLKQQNLMPLLESQSGSQSNSLEGSTKKPKPPQPPKPQIILSSKEKHIFPKVELPSVESSTSVRLNKPSIRQKPSRPPPPSKRPSMVSAKPKENNTFDNTEELDSKKSVLPTKPIPVNIDKSLVTVQSYSGTTGDTNNLTEADSIKSKELSDINKSGSNGESILNSSEVLSNAVTGGTDPLPPPRKKRQSFIANSDIHGKESIEGFYPDGYIGDEEFDQTEPDTAQKTGKEASEVINLQKEKDKPERPSLRPTKRPISGTFFALGGTRMKNPGDSSSSPVKSVVVPSPNIVKVTKADAEGKVMKPNRLAPAKPPPPKLVSMKQKSMSVDQTTKKSPAQLSVIKKQISDDRNSPNSSPKRALKRPVLPPPPATPKSKCDQLKEKGSIKTPPRRPAAPSIKRDSGEGKQATSSSPVVNNPHPVSLNFKRDSGDDEQVTSPTQVVNDPSSGVLSVETDPNEDEQVASPTSVVKDPENNVFSDEETPSDAPVQGEDVTSEEKSINDDTKSYEGPSSDEDWFESDEDLSDGEDTNEQEQEADDIDLTNFSKLEKKAYQVAREMRDSEAVFVDVLTLLNTALREFVEDASKEAGQPVIEAAAFDQIFGYLPHIMTLNQQLLSDFKDRTKNWNENPKISDVFIKKGPYLKMYTTYIQNFEKVTIDLEEACTKFPAFGDTVKKFEATPRCRNLKVRHYMLKPVQRIPQYKMLLNDYKKNLDPNSVDVADTETALKIVSEVATHVNNLMKTGDNFDKLLSIQHSLIGQHNIVKPGRTFIKEGTLYKLSRKEMQQRKLFLLSDLLITTTPFASGQLRLKSILPLAGMKVVEPNQKGHENEFSIYSKERSFTLFANSPEEREEWTESIRKAVKDVITKNNTFQTEESTDAVGDFVLGQQAPVWIPDTRVTMCQICTSEFTITFRRHHCRACGKVVCSGCSTNKVLLEYLNKIARVCDECGQTMGAGSKSSTPEVPKQRRKKSHATPKILKEVAATERDNTISGYLQCKEKRSFRRMWYVVKDKILYTYKASEDVAALKTIPLLGFTVEAAGECEIHLKQNKVTIIFKTDTAASAEEWIKVFKEAATL